MTEVHPSAIVHPEAILEEGVSIGPWCVVEKRVRLGAGARLMERVSIREGTTLGEEVVVHSGAILGDSPQHLKSKGDDATTVIGPRTIVREMATVHRGTQFGTNQTRIGSDCFIMAYAHVAHDCTLGDRVVIGNISQLAGHVVVEDGANLGGATMVSQHTRIGRYTFLGAGAIVRKDVPPFLAGKGPGDVRLKGVNTIGLERNGFSPPTIHRLRQLYRIIFLRKLTLSQALETAVIELGDAPEVMLFLNFVRNSKQGIAR